MILTGKLVFDPPQFSKKQKEEVWRTVAMIQFPNDDLLAYYTWFLKKKWNLDLTPPMRNAHLTFISEEIKFEKAFEHVATIMNGREISIEYSGDINSNGTHWWLRVFQESCTDLDSIRSMIGLNKYKFNYHITLGYVRPGKEIISQTAHQYNKMYYDYSCNSTK